MEGSQPGLSVGAVKRLRRIEGQIRGLQKMVEEGRDTVEVLTQIASVHQALRSTGRILLRAELSNRVGEAFDRHDRAGALEAAEAAVDLAFQHGR